MPALTVVAGLLIYVCLHWWRSPQSGSWRGWAPCPPRSGWATNVRLAEILIDDPEDYVNKAVGGLLREAGKVDQARLFEFLDQHAATVPRVTLRYAIERLEPSLRRHYLKLRKD